MMMVLHCSRSKITWKSKKEVINNTGANHLLYFWKIWQESIKRMPFLLKEYLGKKQNVIESNF